MDQEKTICDVLRWKKSTADKETMCDQTNWSVWYDSKRGTTSNKQWLSLKTISYPRPMVPPLLECSFLILTLEEPFKETVRRDLTGVESGTNR
jgi:hypothetical protein